LTVYKIEIDKKSLDFLDSLPTKHKKQIAKKIDNLATDPYPSNAILIKNQKDIWRIRSGDYRIAYTVINNKLLVLVIHIGDRKNFYKYFERVKF